MITSSQESIVNNRIEIDLNSEEGTPLSLIFLAKNMCDQLGMDTNTIINEMSQGDTEDLINTFEKYFGEFVVLYYKI